MTAMEELNKQAWDEVNKYLRLRVGSWEVVTPYYTNDAGRVFGRVLREAGIGDEIKKKILTIFYSKKFPYGWYGGKGSASEIEDAVRKIAEARGVDVSTFSKDGVISFMQLCGLGVDCSGFVFQVLKPLVGEEKLISTLSFKSDEKNSFRVQAVSFGEGQTEHVLPTGLQPLDLILFKGSDRRTYDHVAIVLMRDGQWWVAQSTSTSIPAGVGISRLQINGGLPHFSFVPSRNHYWNQLYTEGRIEFRRLKLFV